MKNEDGKVENKKENQSSNYLVSRRRKDQRYFQNNYIQCSRYQSNQLCNKIIKTVTKIVKIQCNFIKNSSCLVCF